MPFQRTTFYGGRRPHLDIPPHHDFGALRNFSVFCNLQDQDLKDFVGRGEVYRINVQHHCRH